MKGCGLRVLSTLVGIVFSLTVGYTSPPLKFLENKGQLPESILYYADFPGGTIYLHKDHITYLLLDYSEVTDPHFHGHSNTGRDTRTGLNGSVTSQTIRGHIYKVRFESGRSGVEVHGKDQGTASYNYFIGRDPSRWTSGVRSYEIVEYESIYDGIDFRMYSTSNGVKYDFIVHPGADPSAIQMRYEGTDRISLEQNQVLLRTSLGSITEFTPVSFTEDGKKVDTQYLLNENNLSFEFPDGYDHQQKLTIDPLLIFSTYSGSAADNWGNTATFDAQGNLYSGGMTRHYRNFGSGDEFLGEFITTPGAFQTEWGGIWDVGILKYDSTGSDLIYATYLGGTNSEVPQSLVVNNKGELLILGITSSLDFPTTPGAYDNSYNGGQSGLLFHNSVLYSNGSDLYVAKLSADGSQLLASTYLGGSGNDGLIGTDSILVRNYGDQSRGDIIVNDDDEVFIASRTSSTNFPIENGFQQIHGGGELDALVINMDDDLTQILWSTYYGGLGREAALSIKLTGQNEVFIAGGTNSLNLPTTPNSLYPLPTGNTDGFIARISPGGDSLIAATYLGTTDYDQIYQMDLDSNGDVYVVGQTRGPYPVTPGTAADPNSGQFVHKLTPDLSTTIFSTVFGGGRGEPDIYVTAFLVNDCDNIYISGWGSTSNFLSGSFGYVSMNTAFLKTTPDAYQTFTDGSSFYLAVYTDDMSELLYATFLGTRSSMPHVDGGTSRFDKRGIVYHAVCASCADGDSSFPTTPGAWAEENGSRGCNNAAFKFDLASLNARIRTNSIDFDQPNVVSVCLPFEVAFENLSIGGEIYEWDFGDGTDTVSFVRDTVIHEYLIPGTYTITLKAIDSSTCAEVDEVSVTLKVNAAIFEVSDDTRICGGDFAQLSASGGISYDWVPANSLVNRLTAFPRAFPDTTTTYFVRIVDENGCAYKDSVTVEVVPEIKIDITTEISQNCGENPSIELINNSQNYESVVWQVGDFISEDGNALIASLEDGNYNIQVSLFNEDCKKDFTIPVTVQKVFIPNIITPNNDGSNDKFEISASVPVSLRILNRYGKVVFYSKTYSNDWDGEGLGPGIYYYEVIFPSFESCTGWVQLMY